jgi:hypothetical protein
MTNPTQAVFTPPAANVDDSPISAGEIVKYNVAVGLAVAAGTAQTFPNVFSDLDVTPAADGTVSVPLASFGALAPGSYVGVVTAVTAAGVSSMQSAPAAFAIAAPVVVPNPPTGLKFV